MSSLTSVTDYLLNQSVGIVVLFLAVAAVCFMLRKKTAHVRYLLWLIIIAKCLVPSLITVSLAILPSAPEPVAAPVIVEAPLDTGTAFTPQRVVYAKPAAEPTLFDRLAQIPPKTWFMYLWIAGALLYASVVIAKAVRLHKYLIKNRNPISGGVADEFDGFIEKMPACYMVKGIAQPFVWGLVKGSIYLPANFIRSTTQEHRRQIISHEAGHVNRFDPLVNLLQIIAQTVFFFHPLVWIANRMIRAEREKCCDEIAIAGLNATPRDYGSAIVETLVKEYESTIPIPSMAIAGPIKNIEDRIKTIMNPDKKFYKRPTVVALMFILLIAAFAIPTSFALTEKEGDEIIAQNDNLTVLDMNVKPIAQGKNEVYITVRNETNTEQVFGTHFQTRSVDYGSEGVGWGCNFFEMIEAGSTKKCRFVYKIQGPVTENTWLRVTYYNPVSKEAYIDQTDREHFYKRVFKSEELEIAQADTDLPPASKAQYRKASRMLRRIRNYIKNKRYDSAWELFTKDYQQTEFNNAKKRFTDAMEPTHPVHAIFNWDKGQFLKLKPKSAAVSDDKIVLTAFYGNQPWTIELVKDGRELKIDWIAGYRPAVIGDEESDVEEVFREQKEKLGPSGKRPEGDCSISGKVVSSETGESIGHAMAYLFYLGTHDAMFIDVASDGSFEFNDIPAGPHSLKTIHTKGYQDAVYNPESKSGNLITFTLKDGEQRGGIVLKAVPARSISGKVFDENGRPIEDDSITVMAWAKDSSGYKIAARSGLTDDGSYHLDGLGDLPTYVMAFDFSSQEKESYYSGIYYPSTFSRDEAELLTFDDTQAFEGIDIRLKTGGGYVLKGKITDENGNGIAKTLVTVHHTDMLFDRVTAYTDGNGDYYIDTLGPGQFMVNADAKHAGFVRARKPLSIRDKTNKLDFTLKQGVTVYGEFIDENGDALEVSSSAFGHVRTDGDPDPQNRSWSGERNKYSTDVHREYASPFVGGNGDYYGEVMEYTTESSFIFESVMPGKINLKFNPKQDGMIAKEMWYDNKDILVSGIETEAGDVIDGVVILVGQGEVPPIPLGDCDGSGGGSGGLGFNNDLIVASVTGPVPYNNESGKPQIVIESRFIIFSPEFLEDLDIDLPTGADDDITNLIDDRQANFIIRAVQAHGYSKTLTAPKAMVLDGESATIRIAKERAYIAGYTDSESGLDVPQQDIKTIQIGIEFGALPKITDEGHIRLELSTQITSSIPGEELLYKDKFPYEIPDVITADIETTVIVPDGKTILIGGDDFYVYSTGFIGNSEQTTEELQQVLMLIKPKIVTEEDALKELPYTKAASWDQAFDEAVQVINTRNEWPADPADLATAYWNARAYKDYQEMKTLWPGSGSWDWPEICKDEFVNYVFGKPDEGSLNVPYASADYFSENNSFNLKMVIKSMDTKKGKRYYIVSGN